MSAIDVLRQDIGQTLRIASGGKDPDMSEFEPLFAKFADGLKLDAFNQVIDLLGTKGVNRRLLTDLSVKWRPTLFTHSAGVKKIMNQVPAANKGAASTDDTQRIHVPVSKPIPRSIPTPTPTPAPSASATGHIEDLPPSKLAKVSLIRPAAKPAPKAPEKTKDKTENAAQRLRTYYEEIDLYNGRFLCRSPAPANPNEQWLSDYRTQDLTVLLQMLERTKLALAIGRAGFDVDEGWVKSLEFWFSDRLYQAVVTDLAHPTNGTWATEIRKIRDSFSDDRAEGALILKFDDEFISQTGKPADDRINDAFIESVRSHFLRHPSRKRHVIVTGTSAGFSGETVARLLAPFLMRLFAGEETRVSGMALHLKELNHRQVAEIIWGKEHDQIRKTNEALVKYVIQVVERHMPLLPAFIKQIRGDALKPVNSVGYENNIALQGSRLSQPRPESRGLLTITTPLDGIPYWFKTRLDKQAATHGKFVFVPGTSHTIFNMHFTAGPAAVIPLPAHIG